MLGTVQDSSPSSPGGLIKSGTGTLALDHDNSYSLQTSVNAGTLVIDAPGALGSITGNTVVNGGGTLRPFGGQTFNAEPITLNGADTFTDAARLLGTTRDTLTGPITLAGQLNVIEVRDDNNQGNQLILQGVLSGDALIFKDGAGTLVLSGPDANTNLGLFTVREGTVSLNKPQGKAAIGGGLSIFSPSAVVRYDGTDQIPNTSGVRVDGGQLIVGDFSDVINALTVEDFGDVGGRVTIGSGTLAANGVSMAHATIDTGTGTLQLRGDLSTFFPGEAGQPNLITGSTGTINLTGATREFHLEGPATDPTRTELDVSAIIRGLTPTDGIILDFGGRLRLLGNNTYTGTTTINKGTLLVFGSQGQSPVTLPQEGSFERTLGGTGTIGPLTAFTGTVSPGDLPVNTAQRTGTLSVNGAATLVTGSSFQIQLGTTSDRLLATGAVTLNSPVLEATALPDGQFGSTAISIVHGSSLKGSLLDPASGKPFADGDILAVPVEGTTRNLFFTLHYTPTDVTLTPFTAFPNRALTPVIDEGGTATLTGTIATPNAQETFFLDVSWGDGTVKHYAFGPNEPRQVSVSHQYLDNPGHAASGVYAVQVSWHSTHHDGRSDTLFVTVNNVAPTVQAGGDASVQPGGQFTRPGSFTDPGLLDTWTATVDYGDGTGLQPLALTPANRFLLRHHFAQPGTFRVVVTIYDDDGGVGSASFFVTVTEPNHISLRQMDPRALDAAYEGLGEMDQLPIWRPFAGSSLKIH
jgi:autotransporter-associated beta strand protein